jgi:PST family polysaccharide transporter
LQLIQGVSGAVTFSAFSRLQKYPQKLNQAFFKATELTALIAFPIFIGLIILSNELVIGLFGQKWEPSSPVVFVLAIVGLLMSLSNYVGQLINALGRPDKLLRLQIMATVVRIVGFMLVVHQGIIAVAVVFTVSTYVIVPCYYWLAYKLNPYRIKDYLSYLRTPVIASAMMAIIVFGLKYFLDNSLEIIYLELSLYIVLGGISYLSAIFLLKPTLVYEILGFVNFLFLKRS